MFKPVTTLSCLAVLAFASVAPAQDAMPTNTMAAETMPAQTGTDKMPAKMEQKEVDSTMKTMEEAMASNDPAKMKAALMQSKKAMMGMCRCGMKTEKMSDDKMDADKSKM